jgi:hypothetical protein
MRLFYPVFLLGLATSTMLCGEAHAQFVVSTPDADSALGIIEGTEVENDGADTANAATDAKELVDITEKETDAVPPVDPDPIATAITLQEDLVVPAPTSGTSATLDAENIAEAATSALAGGGDTADHLATATNIQSQALTELDNLAAQEAAEDAKDATEIAAAPNEEGEVTNVAAEEVQVNNTDRQVAEMSALNTVAIEQQQVDRAESEEEVERDDEETALLIDASGGADAILSLSP